MAEAKARRRRDRSATRDTILDAALVLLAQRGIDNLALTDVVRLAGVHRATAYQHFKTREDLVKAAIERFSKKFYSAVVDDGGVQTEASGVIATNVRLTNFVMENPELCRIWLFNVLSSRDPAKDPFWKEFEGSFERFSVTEYAQDKMDAEVMAVIVMASAVLWPVWARAHSKSKSARRELARRYSHQILRLTMFGTMKPEYFPEITEFLAGPGDTEDSEPRGKKASVRSGADGAGQRRV